MKKVSRKPNKGPRAKSLIKNPQHHFFSFIVRAKAILRVASAVRT